MDTISLRQAARELRTSAPRVRRALDRLGRAPTTRGRGHPLGITPADVAFLRTELRSAPRVPGLTSGQARVLAALLRAPLGVVSARALARRASVSPSTASRALPALEQRGLVRRESVVLPGSRARRTSIWRAVPDHPALAEIWPALSQIRPARRAPHTRQTRLPAHLHHLFWTGDASRLRLPADAVFIARRFLDFDEPEAIDWAADNIPADAWRQAARLRGVSPRARALAKALANLSVGSASAAADAPSAVSSSTVSSRS